MATQNSINNTLPSGVTVSGGTVSIDSGTNNLSISTDASATTVAIATGAAVKGVSLGSTTASSTTTIQGPSGGVFAIGVASVTPSNINMVTIDTSSGQLGSQAISGGSGDWILIEAQTGIDSGTTIDFTTGLSATYSSYCIIADPIYTSTDDPIGIQVKLGAGAFGDLSGSYQWGVNYSSYASATLNNSNSDMTANDRFVVGSPGVVTTNQPFSFKGFLTGTSQAQDSNPFDVGFVKLHGQFIGGDNLEFGYTMGALGGTPNTAAVTGIRIIVGAGAFNVSNSVYLYGLVA